MQNSLQIQRILVLGAGTMGQEIALQCAMYGYQVALYDTAPTILDLALKQIQANLSVFVAAGRIHQAAATAVLARLTLSHDARQVAAQADLISESVTEDLHLKRAVFAKFHQLCPAHTIFTTNTSSLLPSSLAPSTGRPAQFAALHFHPHVWESNVVDIMPHRQTSATTMLLLQEFARRIGQIPIVLKRESIGYVFNALLNGLNHAALTLAVNGVASVPDIDRAWMQIMHTPMGPFGIFDRVGLDTVLHVTRIQSRRLWFYGQLRKNARFLAGYVEQGRLGIKSGQGFYSYPNPAFAQPWFTDPGRERVDA
ncbi:MAG: 3-hydroxyacyl-CoA dehydrogenase [Oscillochloris sp.]|nr:3-hydroxyacyl-CoA dehydrogenase [Oscillochloris sp.]